jgi:hypothetical protein
MNPCISTHRHNNANKQKITPWNQLRAMKNHRDDSTQLENTMMNTTDKKIPATVTSCVVVTVKSDDC